MPSELYYCFSCKHFITPEDTAEGEQGEHYCQDCWSEVIERDEPEWAAGYDAAMSRVQEVLSGMLSLALTRDYRTALEDALDELKRDLG